MYMYMLSVTCDVFLWRTSDREDSRPTLERTCHQFALNMYRMSFGLYASCIHSAMHEFDFLLHPKTAVNEIQSVDWPGRVEGLQNFVPPPLIPGTPGEAAVQNSKKVLPPTRHSRCTRPYDE